MTTPEALTALADRVEREEPSRELDDSVWLWVNKSQLFFKGWKYDLEFAPPYTTSLDSAVTLVPEGWTVDVGSTCMGNWRASLRQCGTGITAAAHQDYYEPHIKSGARALTAAALRARAADMQARAVGAPHPSPEQKGFAQ